MSRDQLMDKQRNDNALSRVIFYVERGRRPSIRERVKESIEVLRSLRSWEKLVMKRGLLYRISKNTMTKRKTYLYVLPASLRTKVLDGVHDRAGHQGQ